MTIFRDTVTTDTSPETYVASCIDVTGTLVSCSEITIRGPYGDEILPPRFTPPKERGRWWEQRSRGER